MFLQTQRTPRFQEELERLFQSREVKETDIKGYFDVLKGVIEAKGVQTNVKVAIVKNHITKKKKKHGKNISVETKGTEIGIESPSERKEQVRGIDSLSNGSEKGTLSFLNITFRK